MPSKELAVTIETVHSVMNHTVSRNAQVKELFNLIRSTLVLRELWYFGLEYDYHGLPRYAKQDKKISACDKSHSHQVSFRLRARFYPEDVSELIEDITRDYFYQDVKNQIIDGSIYCPSEAALLLASYQALVRHGAYNPEVHKPGYLNVDKYIPAHIRETHKFSDEEWESKIAELHKQHGDMMQPDAITEYLKVAQELDMYGIRYFSIKNKKNTPLWLGIGAFGLSIYKHDNKLNGEVNFQWGEVRKLRYNRTKFIIQPRDKNVPNITFYCGSLAECKEVLNTCTGNLYLLSRRQQEDPIEVQQMKAMAREMKQARETERERLIAERVAREEAERRLENMQRALQEQELAFQQSQAALNDYQNRAQELQEQLEEERRLRRELEAMQKRLEQVNQQLERESMASVEERARLMQERDAVMQEIQNQKEALSEQNAENLRLEALVKEAEGKQAANGKSDFEELQVPADLKVEEYVRDARTTTDKDYAKQLNKMRQELAEARNRDKLTKVDVIYEENVKQGVDKFRTLRQIRQGNTKKRVEQFECL